MFQSPIYGSRTRYQPGLHSARCVSIPYLRVTHRKQQNYQRKYPMFQSPIYGSRTWVLQIRKEDGTSFNPLSTGHARPARLHWQYDGLVSIPYLRVTHMRTCLDNGFESQFQSPIYGSRTSSSQHFQYGKSRFQSPIYGSRTGLVLGYRRRRTEFQSPIYGSRTKLLKPYSSPFESFNPLFTGHARTFQGKHDRRGRRFQSPIYGSRTNFMI